MNDQTVSLSAVVVVVLVVGGHYETQAVDEIQGLVVSLTGHYPMI